MKEYVEWDVARRSYILFMGRFRRVWAVKHLAEKIKAVAKNSNACIRCKCDFPVDAVSRNTFFGYVIIDGETKQDIKACDTHIFSEIFNELESLGIRHRVSRLSHPLRDLRIVYLNAEG